MSQTPEIDIQKLAQLAKLNLTADEAADFGPQIASILAFVEKLDELDTADVEPMTTALDIINQFREDSPSPSLGQSEATANAPQSADGFFLVPPVL